MNLDGWLLLALASMVFLSISNLMLKIVSSNDAFTKLDYNAFLVPGALAALGIIAALFIAWQKLPPNLAFIPAVMALFATLGVIAMILALKTGKIAIVTAVLSLSTVLVAVLSFVFLGDRFTGREIAAIVLAILSLLILVI